MPNSYPVHHNRYESKVTGFSGYMHFGIRIIAGFLLVHKGILFVSHSAYLETLVRETTSDIAVNFLVNYIGFAHLFGGAFIMLGLLTRFAVVLQLPILLCAIYYNLAPTAFGTGSEVLLSIIVLLMLGYLLYKGSGYLSMDDYMKNHLL